MTADGNDRLFIPPATRSRLSRLLRPDNRERARMKLTGRRRALLVRWVRLLLPMAALAIVAVLVAWPRMEDHVTPARKEDVVPQTVGRNELVNPRFESEDSNAQPFTITAASATQSDEDPSLILLVKPMADIQLNSGNWMAGEADKGSFRQQVKVLFLEGNVRLFHDQGYTVETPSLTIDLAQRNANTEDPIKGHGPAGSIDAQGMNADGASGALIFTGPARLVLNQSIRGL